MRIILHIQWRLGANITDFSCGTYHTVIKKVDGSLYATGYNQDGALGNGTNTSQALYVQMQLPEVESANVKYVKAGRLNTGILLSDGSFWETGYGKSGELGDGKGTSSNVFVQGQTKKGVLNNILTIGKNNGDMDRKYSKWLCIKYCCNCWKWRYLYCRR